MEDMQEAAPLPSAGILVARLRGSSLAVNEEKTPDEWLGGQKSIPLHPAAITSP